MKQIINTFGILLILTFNIFSCILLVNSTLQISLAKEYKADVIAEIENSNFNPNVITSCISQANANGYTLSVQNVQYDEDNFRTCVKIVLVILYRMYSMTRTIFTHVRKLSWAINTQCRCSIFLQIKQPGELQDKESSRWNISLIIWGKRF